MPADRVRLERRACVARIVLDRPEARNALDAETVGQLAAVLRETGADRGVRVVELAAAGTSFSAGADLRVMRSMGTADPATNLADTRRFVSMLHTLHSLPKPTVARVQGAAVGGGVGLVACCDIAVASEDAFFRLSEVRLGLVPAMVGPYLDEALGARVARRLMLTAERFSARQALMWGLVHEVVPPADLSRVADGFAKRLLGGAPGAQATCKDLVREMAGRPVDRSLREHTARVIAERRSSVEGRAGVRAFLGKRRPPWACEQEPGATDDR